MTESTVEDSVRRIETLISALDGIADPAAREAARALLDVVLELHGLALARIGAILAASADGVAVLQTLAADEAVRAVLLLHGLHPDSLETRVGTALDALRPQLAARGLGIRLVQSSGGVARVRVRWISEAPLAGAAYALRAEIEAAVFEVAPDLEALEIEGLDETVAALAG